MKLPTGTVTVYKDQETLSRAVALRISALARQAIAARGVFSIVLAGGQTPRRCYQYLREQPLDWAHVQVYFGDERCLPVGDADRNDAMAYQTLLQHVAPDNIYRIPAELGAVAAAAQYAAVIAPILPLDLVLLGLGEDGHTASLFPGNPSTDSDEPVVAVFDAPKPPPERVSLGLNTLNAARTKLFIVAGQGKRNALVRIALGESLPAARVAGAEWHMDRAASPDEVVF